MVVDDTFTWTRLLYLHVPRSDDRERPVPEQVEVAGPIRIVGCAARGEVVLAGRHHDQTGSATTGVEQIHRPSQ